MPTIYKEDIEESRERVEAWWNPEGLFLSTSCDSEDEARQLLQNVKKKDCEA